MSMKKETKEKDQFYILVNHHYYFGTLNTPKDGALTDDYGDIVLFASKAAAITYLVENGKTCTKNATYNHHGVYFCNHGEFKSPDYRIRKVRTPKA